MPSASTNSSPLKPPAEKSFRPSSPKAESGTNLISSTFEEGEFSPIKDRAKGGLRYRRYKTSSGITYFAALGEVS